MTPDERTELKALIAEAVAEALAALTTKKARGGLLTLEQAGELLGGTSPETIRGWIWRGRLKAYKPGKHPLVRETELLAFVEDNESTAETRKSKRQPAHPAASD